jgi:hypothetical protein
MRLARPFLAFSTLLTFAACDNKPSVPAAQPSGTARGPESAASSASIAAAPPPTPAAPAIAAAPELPPRPFPIGSSGPVQPAAPPEQQKMAIAYTLAMVAPQPNDPKVDQTYLIEILKKLDVAVRTADKGKTPKNPVKATKGSRKIEVEMGKGCTDRIPTNLITSRAGSSLRAAFDAGILDIACHDDRWECHQSTRDPADVLCHAAPRR